MKATRFILILLAAVCLLSLAQITFAQTYLSITVPQGWSLTGCQTRESTHFRIIWGTTGPESYMMTDDYVNGNLNMLENMWSKWFGTGQGQMAFSQFNLPAPPRRNGNYYKISFYVGQTGQTMDDGGGCWCGYDDPTGLPYVHAPADCCRYSPPSGATPHEFGHAYENSAFGFSGNTASGPWWECFANWMMLQFNQTYPNTWEYKVNCCFYPGHGRYYYFHWPIFELFKDKTGYGYSYINRLWTQANYPNEWIMNAMIRLDTSSAPDKTVALKDNFGEMAKKCVTWDFDPAHHQAMMDGEGNPNIPRCGTCYLVRESGSTTWWRVPAAMAPQEYGINFIPLSLPGKSGSAWAVTANLKPLVDSARGTDFRATLVTISDSGTVRYSSTWATGNGTITLGSTENKLYLVVCATPTLMQVSTFASPREDKRSLAYRQNPYEVSFTNATPADWIPTRPGVAHHAHSNGGGFVADSATVNSTAYVGPNAAVLDTAQVRNNARIEDYATVSASAIVRDNAIVSGHAQVMGSSIVQNYAKVRDYALVDLATNLAGNAKALNYCYIPGTTSITDQAVVKGYSMTCTNGGTVNGDSIWDFGSMDGISTSHGIVCGWVAGAPYTTANPSNLYCEYDFETSHPFWAYDKYGWSHGYLMGSPTTGTDSKTARGTELILNGSSQWVELPQDVSDWRDFTVCVWAKWAGSSNDQRLISFGDGSSKQMYITPKDATTGKLRFVIYNGTTTQYVDGTAPLITTGWQHVAFKLSGTTGTLYVNGASVGTGTITITPDQVKGANVSSAGNCNYLGRGNSGNYFNGRVDDFRVYSNAQSDGTIAGLGAGGDSGSTLVAFYQFENNVTDTQGAYNGTAYGSPTYVTGKVGTKAIQFNGSSQYVTINRPVSNDFTIAFFVKTTQTSPTGTQWYNGNGMVDGEVGGVTNDFGISYLNSKVAFGVGNTDTTFQSTSTINTGNWVHVACSRNATTGQMKIYINGVPQTTGTGPTGAKTAPTTLHIGNLQTNINYFNGAIDQLKIYNVVLNDSDIATLRGRGWPEYPADRQPAVLGDHRHIPRQRQHRELGQLPPVRSDTDDDGDPGGQYHQRHQVGAESICRRRWISLPACHVGDPGQWRDGGCRGETDPRCGFRAVDFHRGHPLR